MISSGRPATGAIAATSCLVVRDRPRIVEHVPTGGRRGRDPGASAAVHDAPPDDRWVTPVTDARPVTADPGWERCPAAVWPERPLPSCPSHSDVYADGAAAPAGVQASSVTEDLPPSRGATAAETARPDSGEAAEAPPEKTPPHGAAGGLVLAALGIVFGDIGTSPLYALQTVFSIDDGAVRPTEEDVYGVVSMMSGR
jgi:hypothetical protein